MSKATQPGGKPNTDETRLERDSLGAVNVPRDALYGAQTERARRNFGVAGGPMPAAFIKALAKIKSEAAGVNASLGRLTGARALAIRDAAEAIVAGEHADQFPVDVYQTGSGTSSNMNMNEVLANLAARALGETVHPNDDVNLGQSSNDVIPSALRLAAARQTTDRLLPALAGADETLVRRGRELADVVKTGRTHWMDAMPLTLGQELSGWRALLADVHRRLSGELPRLCALPIGGTAVGTGVNGHPDFGPRVATALAQRMRLPVTALDVPAEGMAGQQAPLMMSALLRTLAIALRKIANDIRMMASGPTSGLGEISLEALQPGSSIMPGKVNPVVCEAVLMASARIEGNDHTVALAAADAPFQLNMMLPLLAHTLLESIDLAAWAVELLNQRVFASFEPLEERLAEGLARNPILATALVPLLGYDASARIVKRAMAEGRPLREIALEETDLDAATLERALDPLRLTRLARSE
ncbi:MAG: class II fumarate hydratase [Burkholderiaceae bacterium]